MLQNYYKLVIKRFKEKNKNFINSNKQKTAKWWSQIDKWREKKSLNFINSKETIKPQHAVQRLYELTKDQDTFITTEVGSIKCGLLNTINLINLIDG